MAVKAAVATGPELLVDSLFQSRWPGRTLVGEITSVEAMSEGEGEESSVAMLELAREIYSLQVPGEGEPHPLARCCLI